MIVSDSTYSKGRNTAINTKADGDLIGEKNELYESATKDHSVEVLEDTDVLCIEKDKLKEDSVQDVEKDYLIFMKSVLLFFDTLQIYISPMIMKMELKSYNKGQYIIKSNSIQDSMLILYEGRAVVCYDVTEYDLEENANLKQHISASQLVYADSYCQLSDEDNKRRVY